LCASHPSRISGTPKNAGISAVMLDMPVPKYVDSASTVSATPAPIVILGIVPSFAMDEDSESFVF
jgi:hypothetical protein